MSQQTLVITHELTTDVGSLNPHAVADWLERAERESSDYNIWEIAVSDELRLVSIKPKPKDS